MPKWKNNAIDLYRSVTMPLRGWSMRSLKQQGKLPVFVLFYHRVSDDHLNDWTMTVTNFTRQMLWLKKHFDVVDLAECQRRIRNGTNKRPTVAVTFDDGYSENGEFAIPFLIEQKIPATYFVTTHHTLNQQSFDHDVQLDKPLPTDTLESLRSYAAAGIEIGGHTRNHIDLGSEQQPETIVDEVITATREMSAAIGKPIRYFAFPYGQRENLSPVVFHLLKEHGIEGVCSAYGGWNAIDDDAFHLQRVHGDPVFARFRNALTLDPRLARVARYDYSLDNASPEEKTQLEALLAIAAKAEAPKTEPTTPLLPPLTAAAPLANSTEAKL